MFSFSVCLIIHVHVYYNLAKAQFRTSQYRQYYTICDIADKLSKYKTLGLFRVCIQSTIYLFWMVHKNLLFYNIHWTSVVLTYGPLLGFSIAFRHFLLARLSAIHLSVNRFFVFRNDFLLIFTKAYWTNYVGKKKKINRECVTFASKRFPFASERKTLK